MGVDCCKQQDSCCKPATSKKAATNASCCDSDDEYSKGGCSYNKASLSNPLVTVGLVGAFIAAGWFLMTRKAQAV